MSSGIRTTLCQSLRSWCSLAPQGPGSGQVANSDSAECPDLGLGRLLIKQAAKAQLLTFESDSHCHCTVNKLEKIRCTLHTVLPHLLLAQVEFGTGVRAGQKITNS